MSEFSVATRYAKSLLDLSNERNEAPKTLSDMETFVSVCKQNPDLLAMLKSPVVPGDKKLAILEKIFSRVLGLITLSFVQIMVRKERAEVLYPAGIEFLRLSRVARQVVTAEVITAVSLDNKQEQEVMDRLKQLFPHDIDLNQKVDPALIGGMVLTIGDRQFDSSVRRQLTEVKKRLINNSYNTQF